MWLLRSVWKDIRRLNSGLHPALRIILLILGIALIVVAWYLGTEWWTTPVTFVVKSMARESPPIEIAGIILGIILVVYVAYVISRDRESRGS